jgi:hypothetical protein
MSHDPESMARAREAFIQWAERLVMPLSISVHQSSKSLKRGTQAAPFSGCQ